MNTVAFEEFETMDADRLTAVSGGWGAPILPKPNPFVEALFDLVVVH